MKDMGIKVCVQKNTSIKPGNTFLATTNLKITLLVSLDANTLVFVSTEFNSLYSNALSELPAVVIGVNDLNPH